MHQYMQRVTNAIFMFPVLPVSAEAQVISGGIVKRLLVAYFIGNISAKKCQNLFRWVKLVANQRFETRCSIACIETHML